MQIASYLEKQFTNIWLFRFGQIEYVAYVLAELAQFHHEFFAIKVIDAILEDIRLGLEVLYLFNIRVRYKYIRRPYTQRTILFTIDLMVRSGE